jgi:hypothetical protein
MAKKSGALTALGFGLLALVAAGLMAVAGMFALNRAPPVDEATLCRTDAPPAAHTVILVDASDAFQPRHKRKLDKVVESERARLARHDRLTILALNGDAPREPFMLFSLCHPGDGRDANPLLESTRTAQTKFEDAFGAPLNEALARAQKARLSPGSPLVESLRGIAADPDFGAEIAQRRIVVVSDLMENLPGEYSLYAAGATYASYRQTQAGARPAPKLEGVSVRLVQLDRDERQARQEAARAQFWTPFFEETGAENVSWDPW